MRSWEGKRVYKYPTPTANTNHHHRATTYVHYRTSSKLLAIMRRIHMSGSWCCHLLSSKRSFL